MGEVYRARDSRLGREVAVKVLPPEFSTDSKSLRRFEQEAQAASALNHPNILVLHDIGSEGGQPYLVSELLEGSSLSDILAEEGSLPPHKAIEWGTQIARGLAAAHGKGIVHRDLKPANLFITREGQVKILDFGLAKLRDPLSGETDVAGAPTASATSRHGRLPQPRASEGASRRPPLGSLQPGLRALRDAGRPPCLCGRHASRLAERHPPRRSPATRSTAASRRPRRSGGALSREAPR